MLGFDVYVYNVTSEELVTVTTDGRENEVYNGIPDWMYEGLHRIHFSFSMQSVLYKTNMPLDYPFSL